VNYNGGAVPAWLAAVGTVGTLSFVTWTWNHDRQHRHIESRQSQARLFDAWVQGGHSDGANRFYIVRLSNASDQAIRNVDIGLEVGGVGVGIYTWGVVPPNASGVVCDPQITESLGPASPSLGQKFRESCRSRKRSLSFVDASGIRWHRTAKGQLRLLYDLNNPPENPTNAPE
jgi:hypothetical protein